VVRTDELEQFLDDLGGRQRRLLEFAGRFGADQATLEPELTELNERLLVAGEELRVQHQQLEQTRLSPIQSRPVT